MDVEKVVVVTLWSIPITIKALRGFPGLTGYYRRFTKDYGKIARPLTISLRESLNGSKVGRKFYKLLKKLLPQHQF